ncbi:carbohydrate ABC transporter permease [Diplocloster modestus]|uniref:Carbohydrate ABC transporter permease n=1 Tax=Diplocloster modestus TaxID=2850322 RepID=A0ABS6KEA4_9FIRM|nr:carbohydrate ABC transporter permease [Diplocloster modestus]MBU9728834.1 carbohydrate ABC transporter permease [Diplocloster modestus]
MKKSKEKTAGGDLFNISKGNRVGMVLFLAFMTLIWAVPVYSLLKDSLKVNGLANYSFVLTNKVNGVSFYRYFINSIINAVCASFLLVAICSFAGFAFSKIEFAGRKLIYNMIIMCLAISGPILIIPLFYIYKISHLYNTHTAVILSECLITIPFGVLMMKNFFDGLPEDLMESANVDGASIGRTFFSIYFPLSKPAIVNLAVLQVMWSFQDFLFPLMFLTKDEAYTTTVAVNAFKGAYGMSPQSLGRYNAALVLISIPTILIFVFAQRFIVNGITSGAVKE